MTSHAYTCRLAAAYLVIVVGLLSAAPTYAQSGRRQDPGKPTKPAGSVIDPTRPGSSTPTDKSKDEVDADDIVRISSNLVPIPVSVVDIRGTAIVNLKLEDFELRVDGQPKPLSDLSRSETNVRIAMLFDNSGSLDFAREFEKHAAVRFFRKVMRAKDEGAVFSIETDSRMAQALTTDVARLEQTINNFGKPEGGTSLFDAIIQAAGYLRPYSGRKVIVIVSDGIETTSHNNEFSAVLHHALADDCQVYVVQTGLYESANLRALAAERRMQQLTEQTGGAVYVPKSVSELDLAFDQIAADLSSQYILSYYPSLEHQDGRMHVIDLKIKSRSDVRLRSRKGYYAPKRVADADW